MLEVVLVSNASSPIRASAAAEECLLRREILGNCIHHDVGIAQAAVELGVEVESPAPAEVGGHGQQIQPVRGRDASAPSGPINLCAVERFAPGVRTEPRHPVAVKRKD